VNLVANYFRDLYRGTLAGWNRSWFSPSDPATLGVIRVLAGAMLFYTHLVWTLDLPGFFGPHGWLSPSTIMALREHSKWSWSWFYWIDSPALLWTVHIAALIVFGLFTIGLWSRATSILAFLATISYINRASLAQFGLDDTNAMLAMYLMVGPSGAAYSVDRWLKRRKAGGRLAAEPSIGANVAIRLLQVHMCVIYLFSGIGKIQGANWWNGNAILMAVANQEYQSLDATWLIHYRWLASLLAHVTVFWEASYCVLVWPRLTRPIVLALAVGIHLGIGAFLGMWTFGLAMIIGNVAFVSPWLVRKVLDRRATQSELSPKLAAVPSAARGQRASARLAGR
jgi:HTTM domain